MLKLPYCVANTHCFDNLSLKVFLCPGLRGRIDLGTRWLRRCHRDALVIKISQDEFWRSSICAPSFRPSESSSSSLATSPVRGLKMTAPVVTFRLSLTMHRARPAAIAM